MEILGILILITVIYLFIYFLKNRTSKSVSVEQFMERTVPTTDTMCGVYSGTEKVRCDNGLRCVNGYCMEAVPPSIPAKTDLPIFPTAY
jgi:hypothetical protein